MAFERRMHINWKNLLGGSILRARRAGNATCPPFPYDIHDLPDPFPEPRKRRAVDKILEGALESDMVAAELYHPGIYRPVNLPFQRRDKTTGSLLLDKLETKVQRDEEIHLDDGSFHFKIVRISPPQGQGQHKRQCTQLDKMRRIKKSIVRINNTDELC